MFVSMSMSEHACAHMYVCWERTTKELPKILLVTGWSMTKPNKKHQTLDASVGVTFDSMGPRVCVSYPEDVSKLSQKQLLQLFLT